MSAVSFLGQPIGFIGLGSMGMSICNRMLCAGYCVKACEIRQEAIEMLRKTGATVVDTPAKTAEGVNMLVICVFTHAQAEAVLFGDPDSEHNKVGALTTLPVGATVVVHTTLLPDQAVAFEKRLKKTGHLYLDAPIVGGKIGHDAGTLTIVAAGVDEAFDAVEDPMRQVGERFFRCSNAAGAASSVKMIDSMLVGIHTVAAAEAITFAAKCGVSPALVHEALSGGLSDSTIFQKWVPTMIASNFDGPGQSGMHAVKKDLSIALEAANMFSYPMPMTALAQQQFIGGSVRTGAARRGICCGSYSTVSPCCGRVCKFETETLPCLSSRHCPKPEPGRRPWSSSTSASARSAWPARPRARAARRATRCWRRRGCERASSSTVRRSGCCSRASS
eukprot:SAG22_NODE_680_length_7934_cov_5.365539_2_plen_390_part_00